jgi:two-component system response regulator YesN
VGEQVHKNTAYISKIFKTEFDCNFSTYVTNKRLDKSTQMLRDPVIKIYEMAEQLGWVDVSNFIKVFKKRYGMSPDEYRKLLLADRVNLQVH